MALKQVENITDHADRSVGRLPQQYKDAPKELTFEGVDASGWEATIRSFTNPAQDLEDIMESMLNERGLETSEGVNLGRLGEILGILRQGLSDADYLNAIYGKISENNSDGTEANVSASVARFAPAEDYNYYESHPAKFRVDIINPTSIDIDLLTDSINYTKLAGVGYYLQSVPASSRYFGFSNDPGGGPEDIPEAGLEAGARLSEDFDGKVGTTSDNGIVVLTSTNKISLTDWPKGFSFTTTEDLDIESFGIKMYQSTSNLEMKLHLHEVDPGDSQLPAAAVLHSSPTKVFPYVASPVSNKDIVDFPFPITDLPAGRYFITMEPILGAAYIWWCDPTEKIAGENTVFDPGTWTYASDLSPYLSITYLVSPTIVGNVFVAQKSELLGSVNINLQVDTPALVDDLGNGGGTSGELSNNNTIFAADFTPSADHWIDHVSQWIERAAAFDVDWQVTCTLHADNGGEPGDILATAYHNRPSSDFSTAYREEKFYFDNDIEILSGTKYWIAFGKTGTVDTFLPSVDLNAVSGHVGKTSTDGGTVWGSSTALRMQVYGVTKAGSSAATAKVSIYNVDGSNLPNYASLVAESAAVDLSAYRQYGVANFPMSTSVALVQSTVYACIIEHSSGVAVTASATNKEYFNPATEVPWLVYTADKVTTTKEPDYQMYMDIIYNIERPLTDYEVGGFSTFYNPVYYTQSFQTTPPAGSAEKIFAYPLSNEAALRITVEDNADATTLYNTLYGSFQLLSDSLGITVVDANGIQWDILPKNATPVTHTTSVDTKTVQVQLTTLSGATDNVDIFRGGVATTGLEFLANFAEINRTNRPYYNTPFLLRSSETVDAKAGHYSELLASP